MVVYDLICKKEHRFEGWFQSAEGYEEQIARKQVSCPVCGSTKVVKLPHACAIRAKKDKEVEPRKQERPAARPLTEADARELLLRVHHYVRENFEDVGPRFAEEARGIYNEKIEKRPIYGTMTPAEREGLDDDNIPYAVIPKPELDS